MKNNGYLVALNEVPKKFLFCLYKINISKYLHHLSKNILLSVLLFTQTSGGYTMFYIMKVIYIIQ